MHPPSYVCKELNKLHPSLRLAWMGRKADNKNEEEKEEFVNDTHDFEIGGNLNTGTFVLLKIVPTRLAEYRLNKAVSSLSRMMQIPLPLNRAQVFGKDGGARDYDPCTQTPLMVIELPTHTVLSGKAVCLVKAWINNSLEKRVMEPRRKLYLDTKREFEDAYRNMAYDLNRMKHRPNGTDGDPVIAKKFRKIDDKHVEEKMTDIDNRLREVTLFPGDKAI